MWEIVIIHLLKSFCVHIQVLIAVDPPFYPDGPIRMSLNKPPYIDKFLNVCPFDYTAVAGTGKVGP